MNLTISKEIHRLTQYILSVFRDFQIWCLLFYLLGMVHIFSTIEKNLMDGGPIIKMQKTAKIFFIFIIGPHLSVSVLQPHLNSTKNGNHSK